jgi:hypothetical protein
VAILAGLVDGIRPTSLESFGLGWSTQAAAPQHSLAPFTAPRSSRTEIEKKPPPLSTSLEILDPAPPQLVRFQFRRLLRSLSSFW